MTDTELPSWQTHRLGDRVPWRDQRPVGTEHLPAMRSGGSWPNGWLSAVEWELGLYEPDELTEASNAEKADRG